MVYTIKVLIFFFLLEEIKIKINYNFAIGSGKRRWLIIVGAVEEFFY